MKALGTTKPVDPIEMIEPDDFQQYAPPVGVTPLARGETKETAPTKGAKAKQPEKAVDAPESPPEASEPQSGTDTPESAKAAEKQSLGEKLRERVQSQDEEITRGFIYETLEQLINAVEWLEGKNKHMSPKDRQIIKLRVIRGRKVQRKLK